MNQESVSDLFIPQTTEEVASLYCEYISMKAGEVQKELSLIHTKQDRTQIPLLIYLQNHSSVAVRRKVVKILADIGTKDIVDSLKQWQEQEGDKDTYLLLESVILKLKTINERGDGENQVLKVGDVLKIMKGVVSSRQFFIEGEINQPQFYGQMVYFGLKDDQDTRIDCRILSFKLNQAGFPLNEGLQVIIKGKFVITKNSRLNFDVEYIKLTGEGELARNLKLLEERLKNEGLFDPSRKRTPNKLPRNILLLASPNSAAINDFTKVLFERRLGGVHVYLLPIKTQGVSAEQEILRQLSRVNSLVVSYNIDTVVMTRGGGSKDDLFVFNSEKIVRAIHSVSSPTIVAIGHERDETLSEYVADVRASTPSNAAQLVSHSSAEVIQSISKTIQNSIIQSRSRIQAAHQYKQTLLHRISQVIQKQLMEYRKVSDSISTILHSIISQSRLYCSGVINQLQRIIHQDIVQIKNSTKESITTIKHTVFTETQSAKHQISILGIKLEAGDPQKVLKKGYTLLTQAGKHISSASEYDKNIQKTLQFHDGEIDL